VVHSETGKVMRRTFVIEIEMLLQVSWWLQGFWSGGCRGEFWIKERVAVTFGISNYSSRVLRIWEI
jgi:hypothetical protein